MTKWIEGEANLLAFCWKCFKESPVFCETTGHCGPATINLVYKWRGDKGRYVDMYLLYMEHPKGIVTWNDFDKTRHMTYEQIRADRNSLLNG